ncbi:sensor histidine kinase [Sulfitobacter sp. S190]|uniref:sensor histidine kinase n=1 Tax=Sulfitobacter sp. S190 TaxID=2867022 RepID=UPI0021A40354|nr:HWE histidine kinase domain-containing protein [Sulfitobacter sp. S190]UWR21233.1 PAS domain-containing protein [Sulfitobacter sp. S190]
MKSSDTLAEDLRKSEARFKRANEIAQLGIAEVDLATQRMTLNPTFQEMCGAPAEISVETYAHAVHTEDRDRVMKAFEEAIADGAAWGDCYRFRRLSDGVMRWFHSSSEIEVKNGEAVSAFGIVRDITAETVASAQLELVNAELHHRVKNLFGMMQSMIRITSREMPGSEPFVDALAGRLQSLTAAHEVSMGTDRSTPVVLRQILEAILSPYDTAQNRVRISGASAAIPQIYVTPVGLLLHELATNAVKYGALRPGKGSLAIDVSTTEQSDLPPTVTVQWDETSSDCAGIGTKDRDPSFGTQLIDRLTQQMGATIAREWTDSGLRLRLTVAGVK